MDRLMMQPRAWSSRDVMGSAQSAAALNIEGFEMRTLRLNLFGMTEEDFIRRAEELLGRVRTTIHRDQYLRAPERQLEVASVRLRGIEELVWNLAPANRRLTPMERDVRDLVVSTRRYSQFMLSRLDDPIVLVIPMEGAVTLTVPYTTTAMTVRRRLGRIPTPEDVGRDIRRFLNDYPGWVGNVILSVRTRGREGIDAEVRRVVGVYATRRESYLEWATLFFDSIDLYRARVRRRVEDDALDSGDDDDTDDSDSGADMGDERGDGGSDGGDGGRGGGGAGAAPALVTA